MLSDPERAAHHFSGLEGLVANRCLRSTSLIYAAVASIKVVQVAVQLVVAFAVPNINLWCALALAVHHVAEGALAWTAVSTTTINLLLVAIQYAVIAERCA
jgi:hypothetical protein